MISYYTEGYVALDVTNPTQPVQLGSYDTFPGADNIFDGAWGVYPYTPSGTIYVSDISSGLYVLALEDGTCPDCPEPVPPCSDCSEPEACNLEPCIDCEHYSGMLEGPGTYDWHPNGTHYFSLFSGIHQGWLVGPTDADFDLELYQWNGFAWTKVDQSNGTASCELISYSGSSGYYAWRIVSSSGRDSYDFWLDRPFGTFP
jgi:hypothetical protein